MTNILSWSNSKTNNQSLTFTVIKNEQIIFNIIVDSSVNKITWYVNNIDQLLNNTQFTWTVPNLDSIWDIRTKVEGLGSPAVGADRINVLSKHWLVTTQQHITLVPGNDIQSNIDLMSGGIIELLNGTFNITSPIYIYKNNIGIRGQGKQSTIIKQLTANTSIIRANFPPTSNGYCLGILDRAVYGIIYDKIFISDMELIGGSRSSICTAVFFKNILSGSINDLKISNVWDPICISGSKSYNSQIPHIIPSDILVDSLDVSNTSTGIFTSFSKKLQITNNIINGTTNWDTINLNSLNGEFIIKNNNFINSANHGLFIYSASNNNIISHNIVINPKQNGIRNFDSINNTYSNNIIIDGVPGIYFDSNGNGSTVINNTIVKGTAGISPVAANTTIKNNIIVGNSGVAIGSLPTGSIANYNCAWNNIGGNIILGNGNVIVDPLFADYTNNDYHLKSLYGRWNGTSWTLDLVTSPAIGIGDPTSNNLNSPWGGTIEMGIYGNTIESSAPSTVNYGSVFLDSSPQEAKIIFDGLDTSFATPYLLVNITSGPHNYTLQLNGYSDKKGNVNVTPGQESTIYEILQTCITPICSMTIIYI